MLSPGNCSPHYNPRIPSSLIWQAIHPTFSFPLLPRRQGLAAASLCRATLPLHPLCPTMISRPLVISPLRLNPTPPISHNMASRPPTAPGAVLIPAANPICTSTGAVIYGSISTVTASISSAATTVAPSLDAAGSPARRTALVTNRNTTPVSSASGRDVGVSSAASIT